MKLHVRGMTNTLSELLSCVLVVIALPCVGIYQLHSVYIVINASYNKIPLLQNKFHLALMCLLLNPVKCDFKQCRHCTVLTPIITAFGHN